MDIIVGEPIVVELVAIGIVVIDAIDANMLEDGITDGAKVLCIVGGFIEFGIGLVPGIPDAKCMGIDSEFPTTPNWREFCASSP